MIFLLILYNLLVLPMLIILSLILSIFDKKVRKGLLGRINSFSRLKSFNKDKFSEIYWFHSASYGEYQQVETLISEIKRRDKNIGIIASFFSPSGFENVEDRNIDLKIYLPFDFIFTHYKVLMLIRPKKIFFSSSDFWPSFLFVANKLNITTILTSARYRKTYYIFLKMFDKIFCTSNTDFKLIKKNISSEVYEAGNPRYDRILNNLPKHKNKAGLTKKTKNKNLILASMWNEDNIIFEKLMNSRLVNIFNKIIIVPHEISFRYINYYCTALDKKKYSYKLISEHKNFDNITEKFIIIDKVGFLSKLYLQTSIAYVGGGFSTNGIHNIIEPAAASNPVIFGPNFLNSNKFDADGLINVSGGFSIKSYEVFEQKVNWLLVEKNYQFSSLNCKSFVEKFSGSTKKILEIIYDKDI